MADQWTIVVPVKGFAQAKSRFADASTRDLLARAFATDLISAALHTPDVTSVIVVSDDPDTRAFVTSLGAHPVADSGAGLNAAICAGAAAHHPVAAVLGDLPCVRPEDLSWALRQGAEYERSYIADASGTGTTILMCTRGALDPHFGSRSAAAHAVSGARRIDGASPALHRDVDTEVDLWDAARIGVGEATGAVLAHSSAPR